MSESKSAKIRYYKSCSALRRFIRKAVAVLSERDPEAIKLFVKNGWSVRTVQENIVKHFMPGQMSSVMEVRLNDAGFKMYYEVTRDGNIEAYVGGDQVKNHPEAYIVLTMLLHEEGLLPERRLDEVSPMTDYWFETNVPKLQQWARSWILENFSLLNRSLSVVLSYAGEKFKL